MDPKPPSELEKIAAEGPRPSLIKDFWHFLVHNKKWWLLPLLLVLGALSLLMLLSTTAASPFIYTLF